SSKAPMECRTRTVSSLFSCTARRLKALRKLSWKRHYATYSSTTRAIRSRRECKTSTMRALRELRHAKLTRIPHEITTQGLEHANHSERQVATAGKAATRSARSNPNATHGLVKR